MPDKSTSTHTLTAKTRLILSGRRAGWAVDVIALAFVLAGCAIDFFTDPDYTPLPFFILPVIYAAWSSPHPATGWICIALTTASNFTLAYIQSSGATNAPYYDALTRILTLVVVYWIALRLRAVTRELQSAKSRLERLNHEKNLLFGVISHDVRGALGVMLASSRLLKRPAAQMTQDRIEVIADQTQTAAQNSLTLLEDLLEWSRLQIGGSTLDAEPVSVSGVINASIAAAINSAEEKKIRLAAREVPPSLIALANERAIRVVLRNIIGNALKFTGEGGEVCVGAWPANGQVIISVEDSGTGIAGDKLQELLSSSAPSSTQGVRGETGTGFGLSMCKDIVAGFGGHITAQSVVGEGSRFLISLPRGQSAAPGAE
ncbi:MAG TPA: HAMP domain-containing sensor histidine kinase [Micropepsaceae bacterium]|nr:HAMP domain-containing sensor histidine kinase [Micropepsaceae bacterium]